MKIKKSDLIQRLVEEMDTFSEETNYKIKTNIARETVNLFFDFIKEALQQNDRVELRGFGSFMVKDYGSYIGRNPKTGVLVEVQPKRSAVFRPGRELKKTVDN